MAQLKSTKVFGDLNVTGEVNASTKITVNGEEVWDTGNLLNIGTTAATARTALGLGAGATRWPTFAEVTGKPSTYTPSGHTHPISQVTGLDAALADKADKTTQVIAGTGLTGGGTLAANRTLAVSYGTTAGTAAQGNDSRITGALQASQVVQATGTSTTSVMSQKATTDQLATKAASSHTHTWAQVTGQPATATRWPTLAEVSGKPANYPTNWSTVADKPVVQTVGTSTTNLMSQKAVTDALNLTYTTDNILGTVSQSVGVPTGAIIERGTNANGEFAKFADGTLICNQRLPVSANVGPTNVIWDFPAEYIVGPQVYVGYLGNNSGSKLVHCEFVTATLASVFLFNSGGAEGAQIMWSAFGRWY